VRDEVFENFIQAHTKARQKMSIRKGNEYANSESDRLANFKRVGANLGQPPETILMVYATKHFDAISHYVKMGCPKVDDRITEPVVGRIYDLQNYLDLLLALLEERHNGDEFERNSTRTDTLSKEGTSFS